MTNARLFLNIEDLFGKKWAPTNDTTQLLRAKDYPAFVLYCSRSVQIDSFLGNQDNEKKIRE